MGAVMTVAEIVDRVEALQGGTPDSSLCLQMVNRAYGRMMAGMHPGTGMCHTWSWSQPWDTLDITADDRDYNLPSTFGGLLQGPVWTGEASENLPQIRMVTAEQMAVLRREEVNDATSTDDPFYVAIVPRDFSSSSSASQWNLLTYPTPSDDRTLRYRYVVQRLAATDAAIYIAGGDPFDQIILYGAMHSLMLEFNRTDVQYQTEYDRLMIAAIEADRTRHRTVRYENLSGR